MKEESEKWRIYNHALIPTTAPHEEADVSVIQNGNVWSLGKSAPLLARWTTDFDCNYETNWWYCIKDTPFDVSILKAKRRYEINKGKKNFNIQRICTREYADALYAVQVAAFSAYPKKYRPEVDKEKFINSCLQWNSQYLVYGAFFKENNELCGYSLVEEYKHYVKLSVQKTRPEYERQQINAALLTQILEDYNEKLRENKIYICDGERNILHETHFQEYLEKYFGFRKAYCKLNIAYNPKIKMSIKALYPIRKILLKLDGIGLIHKVNGVMKMEEIVRK